MRGGWLNGSASSLQHCVADSFLVLHGRLVSSTCQCRLVIIASLRRTHVYVCMYVCMYVCTRGAISRRSKSLEEVEKVEVVATLIYVPVVVLASCSFRSRNSYTCNLASTCRATCRCRSVYM